MRLPEGCLTLSVAQLLYPEPPFPDYFTHTYVKPDNSIIDAKLHRVIVAHTLDHTSLPGAFPRALRHVNCLLQKKTLSPI